MVDRDGAMRWVAAYEQGWRSADEDAVDRLFTPDGVYRRSPVEPPIVGRDAIRAIWREDEGTGFAFAAEPVAVDGDRAVIRATVRYAHGQEYVDLWLLRFAEDGRAAEFEEWPYWPGRGYTASEAD